MKEFARMTHTPMIKKLLLTLLLTSFVFNFSSKPVHAQEQPCMEGEWAAGAANEAFYQDGIGEAFPEPGIDRTLVASGMANLAETGSFLGSGEGFDESLEGACTAIFGLNTTGYLPESVLSDHFSSSRKQNSLRGLAVNMGNQMEAQDPIPLNFAFYVNDRVSKIPFVGTAYAQTTFDYAGADFVLLIWEVFRNIAYGVISIAMLITGILIILRKQLPTKTAVTIQYAFPRLVLSLILITFSYPIGSLAVSMVPWLRDIGGELIKNSLGQFAFQAAGATAADVKSIADLPYLMDLWTKSGIGGIGGGLLGGLAYLPMGVFMILGSVWVFLLWIIILLIAFAKSVIVQLRILSSIVFAPITFAWAAIPGNESMISDWFKLLAARVLTIPAMYFYISLSKFMIMAGFTSTHHQVDISFQSYYDIPQAWEGVLVWMFIPFICTMLLIASIGVGKKIEASFMGAKK